MRPPCSLPIVSSTPVSLLGILCLMSVGCSNGILQGSCAKTQAISDSARAKSIESDAKLLTKAGLPRTTPGGYIDVDHYVDSTTGQALINFETPLSLGKAVKKTRRCTALVSFDRSEDASSIRVWTADHCVRPAGDVALRLQLFGGGYASFEMRSDLIDLVGKARADSLSMRPEAREFFLSAFNTHETNASKSGARACKDLRASYTQADGPFANKLLASPVTRGDAQSDYLHACFSMADLSTFRLRLAGTQADFNGFQKKVWDESKANHTKLREYYSKGETAGQPASDFAVRVGEEMFFKAFQELMNVRRQEAFLGYTQAVAGGRCASVGTPCLTGESDRLRALGARYFDKKNFYESDLAAKLQQVTANPFDAGKILQNIGQSLIADVALSVLSGQTEGREKYRASSDIVWTAIDAGAKASSTVNSALMSVGSSNALSLGISERFQFSFQSNIHPAGKPELVRWQWLSSHRSRGDLNAAQNDGHKVILGLHDRSDPFARVMVFSSHRKTSPYRFEKGDSGTAASVFVFPFGVLSTVDWEETEGVPVTTLPSAGAYSDEPSILAGEGKPGQPGQAGQPGGPARTDASNEPGKGDGGAKGRGKGTVDCAI